MVAYAAQAQPAKPTQGSTASIQTLGETKDKNYNRTRGVFRKALNQMSRTQTPLAVEPH